MIGLFKEKIFKNILIFRKIITCLNEDDRQVVNHGNLYIDHL